MSMKDLAARKRAMAHGERFYAPPTPEGGVRTELPPSIAATPFIPVGEEAPWTMKFPPSLTMRPYLPAVPQPFAKISVADDVAGIG